MITKREKNTEEFAKLLCDLEAIEFIGVAKVLCVELYEKAPTDTEDASKRTPRDAEEVLIDMITRFADLNKAKQRELLKILRKLKKKVK